MYDFEGKTVIITGSSEGIGAALANEFAKCKANLILNARTLGKLELAKQICIKNGANEQQIQLVVGDITDTNVQKRIIETALEKYNKIDILINNAGRTEAATPLELKMDAFDKTINLNLRASVALSLLALPHMVKTKGNIVNISSLAAIRPAQWRISYNVSKAALDMFTKSFAFNIAKYGIRVNSVNPAVIPTKFDTDREKTPENKAMLKSAISTLHPLGRIGKVEEVTNAVLFLASDKASFTTGQIFSIDGGAHLGGIGVQPEERKSQEKSKL